MQAKTGLAIRLQALNLSVTIWQPFFDDPDSTMRQWNSMKLNQNYDLVLWCLCRLCTNLSQIYNTNKRNDDVWLVCAVCCFTLVWRDFGATLGSQALKRLNTAKHDRTRENATTGSFWLHSQPPNRSTANGWNDAVEKKAQMSVNCAAVLQKSLKLSRT